MNRLPKQGEYWKGKNSGVVVAVTSQESSNSCYSSGVVVNSNGSLRTAIGYSDDKWLTTNFIRVAEPL